MPAHTQAHIPPPLLTTKHAEKTVQLGMPAPCCAVSIVKFLTIPAVPPLLLWAVLCLYASVPVIQTGDDGDRCHSGMDACLVLLS